jgi:2-polyprenyl-6-methoxyphenol hydroxylase-like FAD-dependent oxidoreductase
VTPPLEVLIVGAGPIGLTLAGGVPSSGVDRAHVPEFDHGVGKIANHVRPALDQIFLFNRSKILRCSD